VEALSCDRREFIFGSKTSTFRGPNLLTVSNWLPLRSQSGSSMSSAARLGLWLRSAEECGDRDIDSPE